MRCPSAKPEVLPLWKWADFVRELLTNFLLRRAFIGQMAWSIVIHAIIERTSSSNQQVRIISSTVIVIY